MSKDAIQLIIVHMMYYFGLFCQALDNLTKKNFFIDIPVAHDGHLDAIAVWFELKLDDEIVLDSSPHAKSCWDQAVYQIQPESSEIAVSGMHITKGMLKSV